jgi:hypothetical protein
MRLDWKNLEKERNIMQPVAPKNINFLRVANFSYWGLSLCFWWKRFNNRLKMFMS